MKFKSIIPVAAASLLVAGVALAQETKVYTSADTNPIPAVGTSGAMVPSTITVPAGDCGGSRAVVFDVNVAVAYNHTFNGDLVVSVTGPNGSTVTLFDSIGGSSDNMNVVIDDEAASPITGQVLDGSSRQPQLYPSQKLCVFQGEAADGDWTLNIFDNFGGDSGALNGWAIEVTCDDGRIDACGGDGGGMRGRSYANNGRGNGEQQAPPGQHGDHPRSR